MLSRLVITFLPRSKCLLISWLPSPSAVILEPKNYCVHSFVFSNWNCIVGIKTARRNINNLRNADDTTLLAESEEELKSLLIKVKEEGKIGLKHNIQKTKIMASGPITSWEIDGETMETVRDFIFLGSKITLDGDCSHEILKDACSLEEKL